MTFGTFLIIMLLVGVLYRLTPQKEKEPESFIDRFSREWNRPPPPSAEETERALEELEQAAKWWGRK